MASAELSLQFAGSDRVNVSFDGTDSGHLDFTNPITDKDRSDIRWYVETYGARSLADPDDGEAQRIERRLPQIGKALFRGIFQAGDGEANEPYLKFRDSKAAQRVVTIKANDASILSLPWELLHDPRAVFLFREKPHISVRRRIKSTGPLSPGLFARLMSHAVSPGRERSGGEGWGEGAGD